jgi:hypothetical protein
MPKADLHQRLNRVSEIILSVKGRKSGTDKVSDLVSKAKDSISRFVESLTRNIDRLGSVNLFNYFWNKYN